MPYLTPIERKCAEQDIITIKEETRLYQCQQPAIKKHEYFIVLVV